MNTPMHRLILAATTCLLLLPVFSARGNTPFFHYEHSIRKSGLLHRHGIKVLVNGKLLLTHAVENGAVRETQLGTDLLFAKAVFDAWAAPGPEVAPMMCGAPRFGRLIANPRGDQARTVELSTPEVLRKHGTLVRLLERRMVPLHPDPIWEDCLSLLPPADPEVLQNPGAFEKPRQVLSRRSPQTHFLGLLRAHDDDETAAQLANVAWIQGADAFFAQLLITHHRFSGEARDYLQYHGPVPAVFVDSPERAAALLDIYRRERGLDKKFYSAMLALAANRFELAASEMQAYLRGLGRDKEAEREAARILRARDNVWALNQGETTWVRQVYLMSNLFEFWWDTAMWIAEPDVRMPPLAELFYANAFHFARLFAGDTRVGTVSTTPRGRAALVTLFAHFSRHPWWTLPAHLQQDLINTVTAFSSVPQWYGGPSKLKGVLPPLEERVYELTRLRRFSAIQSLLNRISGNERSRAQAAFGKGLFDEEEWNAAMEPLRQGMESGRRDLVAHVIHAGMETGQVFEEKLVDTDEVFAAAAWHMDSMDVRSALEFLPHMQDRDLTSQQELILARLQVLANKPRGIATLGQLASREDEAARQARQILAEFAIARREPLSRIYSLVSRDFYGPQGASAFGLLAIAAERAQLPNAELFMERADAMARAHPEQALDWLVLMTRYAVWPDQAYELALFVQTLQPHSSVLAWCLAVLYSRSGLLAPALFEATYALSRRPFHGRFRRLHQQILEQFEAP